VNRQMKIHSYCAYSRMNVCATKIFKVDTLILKIMLVVEMFYLFFVLSIILSTAIQLSSVLRLLPCPTKIVICYHAKFVIDKAFT